MTNQENPLKNVTFSSSNNYNKIICEPSWQWRRQVALHDYDLWYIVSGKGNIQIRGKKYPVSKGTCMLIYPGDKPSATQDPDERLTIIYNHFNVKETEEGSFVPPQQYLIFKDTFPIENMLHRLLSLQDGEKIWKEHEFDYLMKQIFLHLYRLQLSDYADSGLSTRQIRNMQKVAEYIQKESDRRIHTKELVELVKLSPQYLSILFRKYAGVSLKEYITRARMERAAYLLSETKMNVSQTSEHLGYADIYVFSKLFKKYVGETPSYYKQKSRISEPDGNPY